MHGTTEKSVEKPVSGNDWLKNFPQKLLLALLRAFSYLPLPVIYFIGTGLGEIVYWLHGSRRHVTQTNLTACFPDYSPGKIQRLARHHFHAMTIGVMAMAIAWWCSAARCERLSISKNKQVLDNLMDAKQNIIILAPHFVTLEFLGCYFFSQMKMTSMYRKHKNPYLDQFIFQRRTRFGSRMYHYKDASRSLIKSIRKGVPFYYLPDQDPGKNRGVFAPFYNIQTATYPALNKISRLGNAKVVPCMARLRKFGRGIEIIFEPPLENYPSGDGVKDTTTMNRAIEKLIAHAPEQYFWSHKRFKTRPPGEDPFY
ncbi:lysophospholipid acyltransferase family protein [Candidatus Spongiihabitans sp.]|uniref:lysophospholipid acyltransferase family protein n=1 Tax=Candidatus Spongiihabitans sp. TaxID=3101308 RepID=UPI003C7A03B9